jgi:GTP-binding protein
MQPSYPKIAIVGRPNVGKSALFNRLCGKRISIVDEKEGVTRDRLYAEANCFGRRYQLIDTGGIDKSGSCPFNDQIIKQSQLALAEADAAIFVVDGQTGPVSLDQDVAKILLRLQKPVIVAVNKVDFAPDEHLLHEFCSLSFPEVIAVSAIQGRNLVELLERLSLFFPQPALPQVDEALRPSPIRVAIAGRPNVGKSTLLNQLLGESRAIVSPVAGTTRDAIDHFLSVDSQDYQLVDTAGIRRKNAEHESVDKFAAMRTKEAIARSDIVLLVLDATQGLTTQEKRIASDIEALGKSCILLFNKWDLVHGFRMEHALRAIRQQVPFLGHCPALFISALDGRNACKIFPLLRQVWVCRSQRIPTGALNQFIERCIQKYHPPMLTGKRLRIYYMTQVEVSPPKFIFFVNCRKLMTAHYVKYLVNQFRESFDLTGCPLFFDLRGKKESNS